MGLAGTWFRPRRTPLSNPWLKKNPFLSMWLSGANAVAGSARSRGKAIVRREASSAMTRATNDAVRFWTGGLAGTPTKRKKKRR